MKKIQSIDITLENCEQYNIPYNCIEFMNVEGFNQIFTIHYSNKGECSKHHRAYSFELKVKDSTEIKAYWDFSRPFFKRINTNGDITHITFNYEDGKKFSFYVPWNYNDSQYNTYQQVYINKDSIMNIKIRRNKKK